MTAPGRVGFFTVSAVALAAAVVALGATGATAVFVLLPTLAVGGLVEFFYDSRRAALAAAGATLAVMVGLAFLVVASSGGSRHGDSGGAAPATMR